MSKTSSWQRIDMSLWHVIKMQEIMHCGVKYSQIKSKINNEYFQDFSSPVWFGSFDWMCHGFVVRNQFYVVCPTIFIRPEKWLFTPVFTAGYLVSLSELINIKVHFIAAYFIWPDSKLNNKTVLSCFSKHFLPINLIRTNIHQYR